MLDQDTPMAEEMMKVVLRMRAEREFKLDSGVARKTL